MKRVMQFLQMHPLVAIIYTMYVISWITVLKVTFASNRTDVPEKSYYREGLVFLYYSMLAVSLTYLLITILQAVFNIKNRIFYLRLAGLIALPAAVISVWGYI